MIANLPEQLRDMVQAAADCSSDVDAYQEIDLAAIGEAADEIERLRAALKWLRGELVAGQSGDATMIEYIDGVIEQSSRG